MRTLLLSLALAVGAFGQDPTRLVFDVATIKPHIPRTDRQFATFNNGVLSGTNVSLRQLLAAVYRVEEFQILGGPAWVADDGWDFQAKTLNDTSENDQALPEQERLALNARLGKRTENLLADRFKLVFHKETRQDTIYELHLEKGGHKLEPATEGVTGRINRRNGPRGSITATALPLTSIVLAISRAIGRPVIDKTGLAGRFNFKLDWVAQIGEPGFVANPGAPEPVGPSIFTAVKEQLGLRLEATKGPMEVMVVEKVERPSEN
jgi:uncharacterized protein (TIGR03435 family)